MVRMEALTMECLSSPWQVSVLLHQQSSHYKPVKSPFSFINCFSRLWYAAQKPLLLNSYTNGQTFFSFESFWQTPINRVWMGFGVLVPCPHNCRSVWSSTHHK
jgi:hypothetical protein